MATTSPAIFTAYNHGIFINNIVSYLDGRGVSWGIFAYGNDAAGHPVWQGPYSTVLTADPVPWTPNDDGRPVVNSMQGQALSCQNPPPGDG